MAELLELRTIEVRQRPYCGLDAALVDDLTALAMVFPPAQPDGTFEILFKVWCPEENIARRTAKQHVPYEQWRNAGFITTTPGSTTDFELIENDILELHRQYNFAELGFDRAIIPDVAQRLEKGGLKVTSLIQGFALSPAIRKIEKLVIDHKFCTWGHPVWNWCASNVLLKIGAIKGDAQMWKEKSREKIDVAAAAAMAMQVWLLQPQQAQQEKNVVKPETYTIRYMDDVMVKPVKTDKPPTAGDFMKVKMRSTGQIKTLSTAAAKFLLINKSATRVDEEKK